MQENTESIRLKNRGAPFGYHDREEGTAGNISAQKVGHERNTKIQIKNCSTLRVPEKSGRD
jgi:hypothetical protein